MRCAVEIQGLTKRYGKLVVLDHVSFSVPEGILFGLIGPDGAGKTTLYQILTTLLSPDEGSATVAGWDVVKDYKNCVLRLATCRSGFPSIPTLR